MKQNTKSNANENLHERVYRLILTDFPNNGGTMTVELPTIKQLSNRYNVSEITVRTALRKLKEEKRVTSKRGGRIQLLPPPSVTGTNSSKSLIISNFYVPFGTELRQDITIDLIDGLPYQQRMWNVLAEAFIQSYDTELKINFNYLAGWEQRKDSAADIIQFSGEDFFAISDYSGLFALPENVTNNVSRVIRYQDKVYAIPLYETFPYEAVNIHLLEKLEVALPSAEHFTWERYVDFVHDVAASLQANKFNTNICCAHSILRSFTYLIARGLGFSLAPPQWNSSAVKDFLTDFASIGSSIKGILPDKYFLARGGGPLMFAKDKLAISGINSVALMLSYPNGLPNNVRLLPFPVNPNGKVVVGTNFMAIRYGSPNLEAALQFLKYIISKEASDIMKKFRTSHVIHPPENGIYEECDLLMRAQAICVSELCDSRLYYFILKNFGLYANQVRDGLLTAEEAAEIIQQRYDKYL